MEETVKDTCLYMHTRKSDGRIFYIGIGNEDRPTDKNGRNKYWCNTVNKHDYNVTILVNNLTWERACELEVIMIAFYGRKDTVGGPLVNLTDGGDGHKNPSEEARRSNGDAKRKDQNMFIQQCMEVHKNLYDYSKVEYFNQNTKVTIVCKEHGDFDQLAGNHLAGSSCPKCAIANLTQSQMKDQDVFIQQCKEVHGNTYDYSLLVYKGHAKKVTIICKEHGEFNQHAGGHLSGKGCKEFGKVKRADKKRTSYETFVQQCKLVHGERYDYSKVVYVSATKKVTIICKEHGEFDQNTTSHKNGNGCPTCADGGTKKLTDDQVRWIRKNFIPRDKKYGLKPLSQKFNVSGFLIGRVVKGESYVDVL